MLHRKVVQSYGYWIPFSQKFLSTFENITIVDEEKRNVDSTKIAQKSYNRKSSTSNEIRYILSKHDLDRYVDILPSKLLRRQSTVCTGLYFVNSDSAKLCCSMISEELLKNNSFVVEFNPGFGFLTQELLSAGIYPIHLYEKCNQFIESESPLSKLMHMHQNKLEIKLLNTSNFWMSLLHDKHVNDITTEDYFKNISQCHWKDKTYMQIIVATESRALFALIIYNFFNQTILFEYGRPSFYIILPSHIFERFTRDHTDPSNYRFYTQINVMFNLFFDYKCFGELPRDSFIPWPQGKNKSAGVPMTVVQLEPKKDTFDLINKNDLRPFWFFLKHCMRLNHNRVIKELESLVPGCGPKLIQENVHVFTKFKELSPNKLLQIFQKFKSWPEYVEDSFTPTKDIKKDEEEFEYDLSESDSKILPIDATMEESKD